jgi:S-adenosylmethionine synthetase
MSTRAQDEISVAEDVLAGHPDRLSDAVAEAVVDRAVGIDSEALVGVEVGVHRTVAFVTGRVAAGRGGAPSFDVDDLVRGAYVRAGYTDNWALEPRVLTDLDLGPLADDERGIRGFSDDQSITVGHACGGPRTGFLPPAVFAARAFREALQDARDAHAKALGPDGKVMVVLRRRGRRFRLERLCLSIQHAPGLPSEAQHRLVVPALEQAVARLDPALPDVGEGWSPEVVRLNGAGEFSCGGPHGDNGLSGKKLVVDHYGPGVPIGGGALCGKDPHKVDRVGALRARQIAVRLVRDAGRAEATVWLGWQPGREEPDVVFARADGEVLERAEIERLVPVPGLSIAASFRDLELGRVRWAEVQRAGYFGRKRAWEV